LFAIIAAATFSLNQEEAVAHRPESMPAISHDKLPTLYRDRSFLGMAATQFLGAFNDNLFKQLILLLATPKLAQISAGIEDDRQAEAQIVFAAAFLVFSGVAGFISDRFSKRPVIILSKFAEILVMLLGLVGFYYFDVIGFSGMMGVLFLMGTQSAFFGPSKYGVLPEMLRSTDLPRANGVFLMLTFLAIIFGTALAGRLWIWTDGQVWIASSACVAIAVLGTSTSYFVRRVPVAQPDLRHTWSSWGVSRDIRALLRSDRQLFWAIGASSMFWLVGGMVLPSVNALGLTQLGLDEGETSMMAASIGAGIAVGCTLGGYFSRGRINQRIVVIGAAGTVIMLGFLAIPGRNHGHLLGYPGSIPVLVLMGAFAGMFVVPIQVMLQSRPPREEKGRMIATMNQFSWIGVIVGALIFKACVLVLDATALPRCALFGVTAALMLPVALLYRPADEALVEDVSPVAGG
jgi:acyl-[acyl-carrier-protein]-phospholipid O-acyltransferase/long-chain-fatty-acid--[acyl-carrier-protein] ligase